MTPMNDRHSANRVDLDQAFRTLSDMTRRRILLELIDGNPRHQFEFERLAYHPSGTDDEGASIELHHRHLPHLDEAGFIDWDRETGDVTRGEGFDAIRPLLEVLDDHREDIPGDWP